MAGWASERVVERGSGYVGGPEPLQESTLRNHSHAHRCRTATAHPDLRRTVRECVPSRSSSLYIHRQSSISEGARRENALGNIFGSNESPLMLNTLAPVIFPACRYTCLCAFTIYALILCESTS